MTFRSKYGNALGVYDELEKINEFIEKDIKVKISFKEFVKLSPKDQDEDVKFSKEQYYQYHPEIKQLIDIVHVFGAWCVLSRL